MDGPVGQHDVDSGDDGDIEDDGADLRDRVRQTFYQAWAGSDDSATANPELLPVRLARACVDVLGVDGAGISFYYSDFRVPVGASDDVATLAERLQFTQGEGPCLQSAATRRALVAGTHELEERWPAFARELFRRTPFRAIVSLPLAVTTQSFAAVDLYVVDPASAHRLTLADVYGVSDEMVRALGRAIDVVTQTTPWQDTESMFGTDPDEEAMPVWLNVAPARSRTYVWVAMGMAMTKFELTATDAITLLRSYAYGHDSVLDDVATDLVKGSLGLSEMQP